MYVKRMYIGNIIELYTVQKSFKIYQYYSKLKSNYQTNLKHR